MWPPPIIVTDRSEIPSGAIFIRELDNGERMYSHPTENKLYALQPKESNQHATD